MKATFLVLTLALAGCSQSVEEKAEAAIDQEFKTLIASPRHYTPIRLRKIETPAKVTPETGELWYSNHWELTDSAGIKTERVDTVVVKQNGQVAFY